MGKKLFALTAREKMLREFIRANIMARVEVVLEAALAAADAINVKRAGFPTLYFC